MQMLIKPSQLRGYGAIYFFLVQIVLFRSNKLMNSGKYRIKITVKYYGTSLRRRFSTQSLIYLADDKHFKLCSSLQIFCDPCTDNFIIMKMALEKSFLKVKDLLRLYFITYPYS